MLLNRMIILLLVFFQSSRAAALFTGDERFGFAHDRTAVLDARLVSLTDLSMEQLSRSPSAAALLKATSRITCECSATY